MINVLAGFCIAACFIAVGICYQECKYRNLTKERHIRVLERQIEQLKAENRELTAKCMRSRN